MKKQILSYCLLSATFIFSSFISFAQQIDPDDGKPMRNCGQAEATEAYFKEHPEMKAAFELLQEQQKNQITPVTPSQQPPPVYTIPVVVHILHSYGTENISDANVHDAIRILNEDFRKLNADLSQVVAPFNAITGDAEIEFKLAKLDPNGNCTNGIVRVVTPKTFKASDASKINPWPSNKYLNVYTVNDIASGAGGYTYLPGSVSSAADNIIIRADHFSSLSPSTLTRSRALTHEVGHWLNLPHIWGAGNQPGVTCGDDGVSDTPVTKGWSSCNLTSNDVCSPGTKENVQNYMDYSYCYRMFTTGQCTRMRTAIQSSTSGRNNLWTTSNLAATGVSSAATLCKADFSVNKKIICLGNSVTFTDLSYSVTPTSWQWDFNNDGTTDATTQNPAYTYTASGVYSVKLTVSDGTNSKNITKSSLIVVMGNTPSATVPYAESFENATFPYNDFYVTSYSASSATWNRVATAAYTGSASLKLDNHSPTIGDVDEFVTPSIDFSNVTNPTMSFRVAYQRRTASDTLDKLRVLSSSNCGTAWVQKYSKDFSNLPTVVTPSSAAFTPSSTSQWRQETINISSSAGMPEIRFRFEFTGYGVGNNVYIDDININGTLSIEEELQNNFGLNIYPNPFNESTTINFNIQDKYKVSVGIFDIIGKEIIPVTNTTELGPGSYSLPLTKNNLKPGIYFVRLEVDGYAVMKKVIVQ